MLKFIPILSAVLFVLMAAPARADWCQNSVGGDKTGAGGGVAPCGTIPSSWTNCGTFQGQTVWCYPSAAGVKSAPKHNNNSTSTILIAVGAGVIFVGAMWYFFGMKPSTDNPGQVKLMEF